MFSGCPVGGSDYVRVIDREAAMEHMNFGFFRTAPLAPNGRKVAIIGAGPSGLAAAGYLACLGYQVDVFDKLPKAGD
jgi:glutamate synthase (NADPH) small chain